MHMGEWSRLCSTFSYCTPDLFFNFNCSQFGPSRAREWWFPEVQEASVFHWDKQWQNTQWLRKPDLTQWLMHMTFAGMDSEISISWYTCFGNLCNQVDLHAQATLQVSHATRCSLHLPTRPKVYNGANCCYAVKYQWHSNDYDSFLVAWPRKMFSQRQQ